MINEKEKKELLQKIEDTKTQQVDKKENVIQEEEPIKNGLSESDLKFMNDDLDNFIKNDLNIS